MRSLDLLGEPLALSPRGAAGAISLLSGAGVFAATGSGEPPEIAVQEGVAIVPVQGLLTHRKEIAGATSYEFVTAAVRWAVQNPAAKAIALLIDSNGGAVPGLFDLVDGLVAVRGVKPIWAIGAETMLSAAYAIAAAADRVVIPRTGQAGSIGLIFVRLDVSKALATAGVTTNVIQFGAHKADLLEILPMSPQERTDLQSKVDLIGNMLVGSVAASRRLKPTAVRAQQGASFMGQRAVQAGLVDAISSPEAALAELCDLVRRRSASPSRRAAGGDNVRRAGAALPAQRGATTTPPRSAARVRTPAPSPAASWDQAMAKLRGR